MDPLFLTTNTDPKPGDVIIYQNGQWTTTNINQVVNTYLSQLFGSGLLGGDGGGEGEQGPPGPTGLTGATGATGAAGAAGTGGGGGGMIPSEYDDTEPFMYRPGGGEVFIEQVKTLKRVAGVASSSGDNTVISSVSTKVIKVYAYSLQGLGTVNAKFLDGSGGTQLSILWNFQAREGTNVSPVAPPSFLFKGTATTALILNLSANVSVGYEISYFDDDAS